MESINIIAINCVSHEALLSENKIFSWETNPNKLINVFYMPNGGGKTLLFTAINYMLAGINEKHIEENLSVTITIKLEIDSVIYELIKDNNNFIIKSNDQKISLEEYRNIFNKAINNTEDLYSYSHKHQKDIKKNSIKSIFRLNFFSDNDLKKNSLGSQKSIELISSSYDKTNIKNILGYALGENLNQDEFKSIWEYTQSKNYLNSNKKIYEQYKNSNIGGLFNKHLEEVYSEYSEYKQQLGDISIALIKLDELIDKSNKYPEDKEFLEQEKQNLIILKDNIRTSKDNAKKEIEKYNFTESINLGIDSSKKIINQCIKKDEIITSLKEKVNPIVTKIDYKIDRFSIYFKGFVQRFIKNLTINFDKDRCTILLNNGVNEGKAVLLRILFSIALNIFSKSNNGRIFDIIFLDTMMQGIDEKQGENLFKDLDELYKEEKNLPQLFIFITSTENKYKIDGLSNIQVIEHSII